jgi:selenocysteine lyase/cysteine desulfurase
MQVDKIEERERELLKTAFYELKQISKINILAREEENRLGIISFYVEDIHYNLIVKLLNDHFGVQIRGGCTCAGTYGHYLLHVDPTRSHRITEKINNGDFSEKPGWVRLSLHPTMTNNELDYILSALRETVKNAREWEKDYRYSSKTNEFYNIKYENQCSEIIDGWFK